jgi:hypothetical protein
MEGAGGSAPTAAPSSIAATAAPRSPSVGHGSPPAFCVSAASPVRVRVSTVVVRSGRARRRVVALRTPIARARSTTTA